MTAVPVVSWNKGDRVVVKTGEHADRHGTVTMRVGDEFAAYFGLQPTEVRVALDGEHGQAAVGPGAIARGGRGGLPLNIDATHLEAEAT
jgi:hypothetical protein